VITWQLGQSRGEQDLAKRNFSRLSQSGLDAERCPDAVPPLAACQEAIDTLKETVPLWKKEVYEGGEEWIGRGS